MKPIFINRQEELEFLTRIYEKKDKQLVILYGRRRIGKTELLTHFSLDKKAIYFLADKRGTLNNAQRFALMCSEYFKDLNPEIKNFDEVFQYIKNRIKEEKLIIIIDEFSYLVEKDDSVPSVFQLIFDEVLKHTNIFLILAGSSISMMYKGTLSYESPLYGRRSGEWMVKSMSFDHIRKFYDNWKLEELIKVYAVVGGIPAYAVHFNGKEIFEAIKNCILTKGEYLYNEPEILLKEELRDPSTYFSILEAMVSAAKLTDIANAAKVPAKDMPKYLKVLEDLEIIYKIIPVTEKKSKKTLYFIKDNFFSFWFRFIYPKKSELEASKIKEVLEFIKKDFNSYVGRIFEQICHEYLKQKVIIPHTKIGKWWGYSRDEKNKERRMEEIDLITIDERTKNILYGECKWQENVDAQNILQTLKKKASLVKYEKNKEFFILFAKSFKEKKNLGENVFLFELKDLEK